MINITKLRQDSDFMTKPAAYIHLNKSITMYYYIS